MYKPLAAIFRECLLYQEQHQLWISTESRFSWFRELIPCDSYFVYMVNRHTIYAELLLMKATGTDYVIDEQENQKQFDPYAIAPTIMQCCRYPAGLVNQDDFSINTLGPKQNGCHFADDIFVNENVWIPIRISLKFVPKGPINNIPALVQIMAWRREGDKPLSEPTMVSLSTHICVTRPQWVT